MPVSFKFHVSTRYFTYVKLLNSQVVHGHPNRAAPVVLLCAVKLGLLAQTANAVRAKEVFLIANEVQNPAQLGVLGLHQADEEGHDGNVALVADKSVLLKVI